MRGNFIYKRLGGRIIDERKKKRITQEQLAEFILVDRTYLARIELGRANPSIKILHKISRRLRIKMHELLVGV